MSQKQAEEQHADILKRNEVLYNQNTEMKRQMEVTLEKLDKTCVEQDQKTEVIFKKFSSKVERQFDDFMLKVDGELTRRNRLRVETFN